MNESRKICGHREIIKQGGWTTIKTSCSRLSEHGRNRCFMHYCKYVKIGENNECSKEFNSEHSIYCKVHECSLINKHGIECNNCIVISGAVHCREHVCTRDSLCNRGKGCKRHRCRICPYDNVEDSLYCEKHKCAVKGCDSMSGHKLKIQNELSVFCKYHRKQKEQNENLKILQGKQLSDIPEPDSKDILNTNTLKELVKEL